jgi:lactoylglutathione lyase
MTEFRYDHVHLRSPDPDATAAWYERMFGAEVVHSVMSNGIERTDAAGRGQPFHRQSAGQRRTRREA